MRINAATLALLASALLLPACQSNRPPVNYGSAGGRMDPTSDSPSEVHNRNLRSADLIAATDRMAMDIARRLDVNDRESRPKIFVGEIENKTRNPHFNYQIFLTRLRANLNSSGPRHGLEFIREREFIETQRSREYGGKEPASSAGAYQSRADYVLTAEIYDLPSGGTNFYLVDYQLVQLRDASTGPDVGAGAIVWENSYEVKFQ